MIKLTKNSLKLIKNLKNFVPSTQSLRSDEAIIKTIQDLYEQCLELVKVFGSVVAQIVQEQSGYYHDLSDIPQIGQGSTFLTVNKSPIGRIDANAVSDTDIDISVPTNISELNNDINYVLLEQLDEILALYAKITSIPTKLSQLFNDEGFLTEHQDISGKADKSNLATVATSGSYNDLKNKPTIPTIPTKISAFENDEGYLKTHQPLDNYYTKQEINNKGYLTEHQDISGKVDKINGKGLSTNDYTTAEKNKLAGIAEGAEQNVNADWEATSGDAKILNKPVYALGTSEGGAADRAAAIPFGRCDSTSTSTKFTATVSGITELKDGVCVLLDNGVVTSASGFTLNINGLGAKPVYNSMAAATRDTTIFNANYTMLFVYDETRVSGGCWVCYRGYDNNTNTIGYQIRYNNTVKVASDTARYYKIYFTSADGDKWVPASVNSTNNATSARPVNQRPIDPFGCIAYTSANSNFAAGANVTSSSLWTQYNLNLGYSFNRTGEALELTNKKSVYVKCAPQADGSAIMDADTPIVQDLPTTKDRKIYIYLGVATSNTAIELNITHPVYWHDGEGIRLWTGKEISSGGSTQKLRIHLIEGRNIEDPDIIAQWQLMINDIAEHYSTGLSAVDVYNYFDWTFYDSYFGRYRPAIIDIEPYNNTYCVRSVALNGNRTDWIWYYDANSGHIVCYYDD